MNRLFLLLFSVLAIGGGSGCATASEAELLSRAHDAGAEGDLEGALSSCQDLSEASRGGCVIEVLHVLPDRIQVDCDRFPDRTHDECEFQKAEALVALRRDAEAIAACQRATAYRADCAEHLWKAVYEARPAELEQFLVALRAGLPDVAHTLGRPMLRKKLRLELNDIELVSPDACPADAGAMCTEVLAKLLRRRWVSAAQLSADAKAALCAGREGRFPSFDPLPVGWKGLQWKRGPELDAAFLSAAEAACTAAGDDRSAKGLGVHAVPEPLE